MQDEGNLLNQIESVPHLSELLQHRLAALTKLVAITRRLAAEVDLERILKVVTTEVQQVLDCERASLFMFDAGRQQLYTKVATALEIKEIRAPLGEGITGWVGRHRRMANVPDPAIDERWNGSVDRRTGFQTRNILAAPLVSPHDGKLLGVLELLNKHGRAFDAEDEQLLQAFADDAAIALERAELLESLRQSRELEGSLEAARNIQASFLPESLPQIEGYELAAWWQPAQGVGGDYYDVIPLPDGRLALAVADVSGHGLGPSLIMASARAMLHVLARTIADPGRILSLLSDTISPDLKEGRFITFFLGALDPVRHEFRFVNAGHGPALHLQRQSASFRDFKTSGFPIGVTIAKYAESREPVEIEPGDLVLLATDGAIELRNASGEMFGRERLERLVLDNQTLPAPQLLNILKQAIHAFLGREHPEDDITVLILERKQSGSGVSATTV